VAIGQRFERVKSWQRSHSTAI